MNAPTFAQPARRSFLMPILVAVAALALAIGIGIHFFPATTVSVDHLHTEVLETKTKFKSDSIVLNADQVQTTFFIASTIKVDNQLRGPIYLDDFSLTFTDDSGAEMTFKAATKDELSNIELSFPAVKTIAGTPLLRETAIDQNKQAQGTLVFSAPFPKALWEARKSAVIKVDLYHQPSLYVTIPKPN